MLANGVTGPEGYAMAHTAEAEEEAVMRASTLANQVNCPLYLSSITSDSSADIVKVKKSRGNVLYADVTPAALACDGEEYWNSCWNHAASFVTCPPLRKGAKEALVEAAANSTFEMISSDHTTYNSKQKALGIKDFTKIPPGIENSSFKIWMMCSTIISIKLFKVSMVLAKE
jgi:dihydroorotase-like cyclic amidohydrolase